MARKTHPKPGDRHNMLTYIGDAGREPSGVIGGRTLYATLGKWRCDCGKEIVCRNRYVVNGLKKSCGCLLRAKGEAWRKGERVKPKALPALRFLVTVQMLSLDTTDGGMVQYAPESPNQADEERG